MQFLQGKKTYAVVGIFVLALAGEMLLGIDVPGFDPGPDWLGTLLAMLGLGTIRHGIAKA